MEDFLFFKALMSIAIAAIGGIAAYKVKRSQTLKIRAELLERLEVAMAQGQKHYACELFYMLNGLRKDFEDIVLICQHGKVSKIILALQTIPGTIKIESGKIEYNGAYKSSIARTFKKWFSRVMLMLTGAFTAICISYASISSGPEALAMLLLPIPLASFLFFMQLKDITQDKLVDEIVSDRKL